MHMQMPAVGIAGRINKERSKDKETNKETKKDRPQIHGNIIDNSYSWLSILTPVHDWKDHLLDDTNYLFFSDLYGLLEDSPGDHLVASWRGEGALVAIKVSEVVGHQLQQAGRLRQHGGGAAGPDMLQGR